MSAATVSPVTTPAPSKSRTSSHKTRAIPDPTKPVAPRSQAGRPIQSSCPSQGNVIFLNDHFNNRTNC